MVPKMRRQPATNRPRSSPDTSWNKVAPWYQKLVGRSGHYYHEKVILPNVLRLLALEVESSVLDLGCGEGVLARALPKVSKYLGVDKARQLIATANKTTHIPNFFFKEADVTRPLPFIDQTSLFSHATVLLALQNMDNPEGVFDNLAQALREGGTLVVVLNHPCFRIPRQSGWGNDPQTEQQYRWLNRYQSAMKIPITMNPGKQKSQVTWSFHHSLQDYCKMMTSRGFVITELEEWYSDKESYGKAARRENQARSEIPLFMGIVAEKKTKS